MGEKVNFLKLQLFKSSTVVMKKAFVLPPSIEKISEFKGLGVNRKAKKNTRWNCPFWVQLGLDVYIHI